MKKLRNGFYKVKIEILYNKKFLQMKKIKNASVCYLYLCCNLNNFTIERYYNIKDKMALMIENCKVI